MLIPHPSSLIRNIVSPLVEELIPSPDPSQALRRLRHWSRPLLLESAKQRPGVGRYSFLTADPLFVHDVHHVDYGSDPLAVAKNWWQRTASEQLPGLPPFQGGIAGLMGYGTGRVWERIPLPRQTDFDVPDVALGLYDWVLAWDHSTGQAWIIAHGLNDSGERSADRAARRIQQVRQALSEDSLDDNSASIPQALPLEQLAPQYPTEHSPRLTSNFTREGYLRAVRQAVDYIHAGDIFQVNLSQRLLYPQTMGPCELYGLLRACNPAPFAGYYELPGACVVSASPERFLAVREGEVETRPIKGTRRRQSFPEADLFTKDELRESEKDQAENVMIVDLLRNDLSRVCLPGTVRVPQLCEVETYETVQHLVSEIRGKLKPDQTPFELLAATFPGGSITGAPKVRAMEIIAELEPTARGPYCGSLVYVSFGGAMDSSILIRTFTVAGGWIQCPVGGGIVAQSDPLSEYFETWHKAAGMLRALE